LDIKTKYEIGDYVEYKRLIEHGNKKHNYERTDIAIIKSMAFDGKTLRYYFRDGYYPGGCTEADILRKL
jgi:hypothetical protein